jgi:hypothetical protein
MIKYTKRRLWKYKLAEDFTINLGYLPRIPELGSISTPYLNLDQDNILLIRSGYCWDGPSGPMRDKSKRMTASLVHDALYQLMRSESLPQASRKRSDEIFREILIQNGVSKIVAHSAYKALRMFGAKNAKPNVLTAP